MPIAFIDSLDDPVLYDQQANFAGGQVSHHRAVDLGAEQAWLLEDVDLESNGALRTRLGWHALGDLLTATGAVTVQGAWWFDSPTWEGMLVVAGGKLWKGTVSGSTATWTKVADSATGSATLPAWAAQVNETIYIGTGTDRPKFWTATSIATPAAGTQIDSGDGPATLSHLCAQNFRMFGLNAATPDELWCTGYLPTTATPFGDLEPFRVGDGEGDPITVLQPWKGWNLIAFKSDATWAINTQSQTPTATHTADFAMQRISSRVGCIAGRSCAAAGNDLLFLARDGVRSLARTQEDGDGAVSLPLSEPIQDVMDRINMAHVDKACAGWWRGRYMLAVPLDSSTVNNALLVLNLRTGGWMVWSGLQPVQFATSAFNGQQQRACMLDRRGQLLVFRDHVLPTSRLATDHADTLDGSTFTKPAWRARTRSMAFGEALNPKQPRAVEITFDKSEAMFDLRLIRDDDEFAASMIAAKQTSGLPVLRLPFTLPATLGESRRKRCRFDLTGHSPCRSVAVEITEADGMTTAEDADSGPLGLSGIIASAWLNAAETTT